MIESFIITILLIIIYIFYYLNKKDTIHVTSSVNTTFVINNDKYNDAKTKLLNDLIKNIYELRDYLKINISKYPDYTLYFEQLYKNLNQNTKIYETDPSSGYTSYSINKGEELSFCLISKKTKLIHDLNLVMYVALHEISHIACPEIGHGFLFQKIFRKITEIAIDLGKYKKINFSETPLEYCGMNLSTSIVRKYALQQRLVTFGD